MEGAVQATNACAFPARAERPVGAAGTVMGCGTTIFPGAESALDPSAFVAETSNSYDTPLIKPVTVAVFGTAVLPAGAVTTTSGAKTPFEARELCTVKLVTGCPSAAGLQLTFTCESPGEAATLVGVPGGAGGGEATI